MFTVVSATSVRATVPAGAVTGAVTVTTTGGTATSAAKYTVTLPKPPAPKITTFSPWVGKVGGQVTVRGTNLRQTAIVSVGGVPAKFTVVGDTQITVTIPKGSGGVIKVTTPGGAATTTAKLVVR